MSNLPEDFIKKLYAVDAKDWKYERSIDGAEHYKTSFDMSRIEEDSNVKNEFGIDIYRMERFYPHASPIYGMTVSYSKEEAISDDDGFSVSNMSSGIKTFQGDDVKEIFARISSKHSEKTDW